MKACPPLRFFAQSEPGREPGNTRVAISVKDTDGELVADADLMLRKREKRATVDYIRVNREFERCGVGTKIYEKMLEIACATGMRFTSDISRTDASEGFWRKQVKKGRARCVKNGGPGDKLNERFDKVGFWECERYELKERCPVDRSLAGVRKSSKKQACPCAKKRKTKKRRRR